MKGGPRYGWVLIFLIYLAVLGVLQYFAHRDDRTVLLRQAGEDAAWCRENHRPGQSVEDCMSERQDERANDRPQP
jgi:hypothetical protein